MEGLPYDFESDDEDSEVIAPKKPAKRPLPAAEIIKKEVSPETEAPKVEQSEEKEPQQSEELEPLEAEDLDDNAPELDGEAPLEHLSRPETEAIAQTMASERLAEIEVEEDEVSSESLAAESFLENVEATGDIDQAYSETVQELGEAAIDPSIPAVEVETETAPPIDPAILVEAAKSEIGPSRPDMPSRLEAEEWLPAARPVLRERRTVRTRTETKSPPSVFNGVVDYLVGRRHGRMSDTGQHEVIERKLTEEVKQLRLELSSHEAHVRELARNRTFEKKNKAPKSKPEKIGKVIVEKDRPKSPEEKKVRELAGISAHTMELPELTKIAEEIPTGNSTLEKIYETHLVGEQGLRRVVAEFLRGGNYQKALKRELLEREKDFERDPYLRDQASTEPVASQPLSLDRLLKKTGIDWNEPQPMLEAPEPKGGSLPGFIEELRRPNQQLRKVVDMTMIGIIFLMTSAIILLIIYR